MLVLGITGDIGAGKSTVSSIIAESGATVINADLVAHEIWKRKEIILKAVERWGDDIIISDDNIDSNMVASLVFRDDKEYKWLCDTLHPLIRMEMEKKVMALDGLIVVEIPLLFENGIPWWVDATMYVSAPYALRLERNKSRGWDDGDIARRESFLFPSKEKMAKADIRVINSGDIHSLRDELINLSARLKDFANLSEISFTVPSKEQALEIASAALREDLVLDAKVKDVYLFRLEEVGRAEDDWEVRFLAFQKRYNAILDFLAPYRVSHGTLPPMKAFKRPGSLWKKYVSSEIRT